MRNATAAAARRLARRLVGVALLALAAQVLLPYLHASLPEARATHSADCTVCVALAHGGARAFDAPATPSFDTVTVAVETVSAPAVVFAPSVDRDTAGARAPPASLLA